MSARDEAVEMIRRICPPHLDADEYGQILAEKFDAYRAEVLAELREASHRRKRVSHKAVAAQLRTQPGEWGPVGDYSSSASAVGIVSHIRTAFLVAYRPAGAYEARTEMVDEGTRVHARYVGAAS